MSDVITVENLSKQYIIGHGNQMGKTSFREALAWGATAPFRWAAAAMGRREKAKKDELWALKDVTFKVEAGEVLGIVGRNGAGKSTLLKVLSRITQPTSGRAEVLGRVGSLLEVGTGFHPELSGRENVYLYGAILGMSRREIAAKFDEIVAFSEVERFLDTPVKRYSSGMYTRLGFAVASHLDPHILIVDEVLAVGDVQFQKKCMKRMDDARKEGRTILFVSHSMSAVKSLCTRGILMEGGKVAFDGNIDETVNRNLNAGVGVVHDGTIPEGFPRYSDVAGEARVTSVRLLDMEGQAVNQLFFGQLFQVEVAFEVMKDIDDAVLEISFGTHDGVQVTYSAATDGGNDPVYLRKGKHELAARFEMTFLPRDYSINVGIHHQANGASADYVERTLDFTVLRVAQTGRDHYHWPRTRGLVRAPAEWSLDGEFVGQAGVRMTEAGV